ncbi:MAG: hydantoinase/oxoprolinase family protein, partial [candidate division NC10 bacterium]
NTLVTDMGGTSFDLGLIVEGRERTYEYDPIIDRWRVQVPLVAHWSIGAGGGSIARVETGILKVGPQSARALPGPACYARGGEEPTVTDADLVLGYIDPAYFLGGRIALDAGRAEAAIREKVAEPLATDLMTAAWSVKQLVDGTMGQEIYRITALTSGLDPREFTIFALGGAGPVHAVGYALSADVPRCATFPFGSVFGAFGALNLDILQTYEKTHSAIFFSSQTQAYNAEAVAPFNAIVQELLEIARRDMEEEGFELSRLTFQLEVLMRFGQQRHTLPVDAPNLTLTGEGDVRFLVDGFVKAYADAYGQGAVFLEAGVELLGLRLNAVATQAKPPLPRVTGVGGNGAPKGKRRAYWGPAVGVAEAPVYQREQLGPGQELVGPALIESEDTVCVLPPGWRFRLDDHLIGWLDRTGGA